MADARLGQTLSHYEIVERLGEGGMGVVYKARDSRLDRLVAIKVLPHGKVADPDRRRRFVQEAKAASALNHPNIVTIHEIGESNNTDFIAMEYVVGKGLDRLIPKNGMRLGEVLKCAIQIAGALARAHTAGIIHRDIKPANIMITPEGLVKVLDFGLAKLTETVEGDLQTATMKADDMPQTEEGSILGTTAYMSPEQAEGKRVDARSDIFSFGSLLYEMATGRRAFQGDTKLSTLAAILNKEPASVREIAGDTPRDLEKTIVRCLRKDPDRRFQHMDDVKIALEELKEESDSGRLTEPERPAATRRRTLVLYAALASPLVVLLGAVFLWRFQKPTVAGPGLSLRQLTQDTGFTGMPSISPDGKLVAYASDRAGDAGLDIWVQQLSRGSRPIRLTRDKADDDWPSFSPDSGQIVFSSEREGGGIYIMPALGGEERLLLRGHLRYPRFSPDGQFIVASTWGSSHPELFVVSSSGGPSRQIAPGFYWAARGLWSPDGKGILFDGRRELGNEPDWWVAPLDGGPPVRTGIGSVLPNAKTVIESAFPGNGVFEWMGNSLLVSDGNLWRVELSPQNWKAGKAERLTTSSSVEGTPRAIRDGKTGAWRIVFAALTQSANLWFVPISHNAPNPFSAPVKLIPDGVFRTTPSLAADGSRLGYVFKGLDGYGIRVRDMKTSMEKTLVQSQQDMRARISPDGTTVAYNLTNREVETTIYVISSSGGDSRKLCDTCGLLYDWSPDGKKLVYRSGRPMRFSTIDIATGQSTVILADSNHQIYGATYSPDMKWIAMHYAPNDGPPAIFITPARDGKAAPQSEWIPIMDRPSVPARPAWSADGSILYFTSNAGGQFDVWAQRLNAKSKRPIGDPVVIYHPQGERLRLNIGPQFGPALIRDQLIFPIYETGGNVWIAE
jgi:serine/threonine protein kinase